VKKLFQSLSILVLGLVPCLPAFSAPSPADVMVAGRVDDAIVGLNRRIQGSPNDAEAYHLLSKAYYHLRMWDQAIAAGEHAVAIAPGDADYWLWLGRAYGEKADASSFITAAGLTKKVKSAFEKAVQLDNSNVDAASDLAEFYLEAPGFMGGGLDKARDEATRIATLDQAKAHWVNARIAEKKKDYAGAEREFQEAIKASGNNASYWLNLASFYRRAGRYSDMEATVKQAVAADKRKNNAYYDAATIFYRAGRNLPDAANLIRRYLSTSPSDDAPAFQAHYLLGAILEKEGDKQGAAAEYRTALSLASAYKPAQDGLKRVSSAHLVSGQQLAPAE